MCISSRIVVTLSALVFCVWATATQVRHFAGTPSAGMNWLLVSPAIGCLIALLGLAWERGQAVGQAVGQTTGQATGSSGSLAPLGAGGVAGARELEPGREILHWRQVNWGARALQYGGWALLTWRSIWMFFSWDGMFLFPAWILLSLALYRWHPRSVPCA